MQGEGNFSHVGGVIAVTGYSKTGGEWDGVVGSWCMEGLDCYDKSALALLKGKSVIVKWSFS